MKAKACLLFMTLFFGLSAPAWSLDLTRFDSPNLYSNLQMDKKISMDFKDASLNDVLKIFSQQSGLNFIASSDISSKTLNLYLDQVPVEEALEKILAANNLTYELNPEGTIFTVKQLAPRGKDLVTRVYPLKYATVSVSNMETQLSGGSGGSSAGGSSGGGASGASSSIGTGLIDAVKAILTADGLIVEDARTNSLIISDAPSQFPRIEQTIARLDVRVPQILIEVEMLDIAKSTGDLLGVKYGETFFNFTGGGKTSALPFNVDDWDKHLDPDFGYGDEIAGQENAVYRLGALSFQSFTAALDMVRKQNDTRSLARPRILTLNNQTAEINISTDETIGEILSESDAGGISAESKEAERTKTGVFLKVTPQANVNTGEIVMAIEPKVIEAQQSAEFPDFKDPEERGTKALLRIMDGDTIIMAGLLRTETGDKRTSVPFFSSVPIVGAAFKHKDKQESERELVIFITPHIVNERPKGFTSLANSKPFVREQTLPEDTLKEINSSLSSYERGR